MEMLDPRILQGNTTQINDVARNVQEQRLKLQNQSLTNTQNAQNYGAMIIAQAASSGNPALYNSARQKLASMGIDVTPYSDDPAEAAMQAQQFRTMGASPTAQLSALMQQKQMQLRAQTAGIDPSSVGLSGGMGVGSSGFSGVPSLTPPPLSQGSGDPTNEFLAALANTQATNGVSPGQNQQYSGVPVYDPSKYRTYKEYENALKAFESQMKNDPAFQARMEAAKTAAVENTRQDINQSGDSEKKAANAQSTLSLIKEARQLLPNASDGGLSALGTAGGRFIGMSTDAGQADDALKVIGASLTMNIPRMEGPQSDRDTAMYKAAAANVADPTIPVGNRLAALDTLEKLSNKYSGLSSGKLAVPNGGLSSGGIKFLGWE